MNDQPNNSTPKPTSPHSLNQKELRASTLLPVVIPVGIVLLGMVVWLIAPDDFNTGLAIAISLSLLLFLLYWMRREPARQRVVALVLAIPALVGLSVGMSNGRIAPILLGFGLTGLLLVLHRAVSIPISYRFATRRYQGGDLEAALALVEKTIATRPDFWESYQLKALIFLAQGDFPRAERAAKEAMSANPQSDAAANTLGQIYLAQAQFDAAKTAYIQAVTQNPDHALHWYHLGLCQYRLGEWAEAVDSLVAATKRAPHILEYELWMHYYLWRCLQSLGREEQAAEVHTKMRKFAEGLPLLQEQLAQQPETPHLPLVRADLDGLARELGN
ncbi:MAG: tetratricopeptide repeat protein [Anaerolineae bacterium]|nr:tetratricopeptide repeat protein [Anaerolineae bacterium]